VGTAADAVISSWPEVVVAHDGPANTGQVQTWVAGPGAGTDAAALARVHDVLDSKVPVVLDADALTLLSKTEYLRERVLRRHDEGLVTAITPHDGEFARLGYEVQSSAASDRVARVRLAAKELGAVVLLKGSRTVVASPEGDVWVNTCSDPGLSTAGTGDLLTGLGGSILARMVATTSATTANTAEVLACAAYVHGFAGRIASGALPASMKDARRDRPRRDGRPITARDILSAVPSAIAAIRNA